MLEDSTIHVVEETAAEAFTGGYVYLTRIQTSKRTLWYAGKKHRAEFDATYFGSGRVISAVRKKYGSEAFQTKVVGWAHSHDELNQLERDVIAWCRAEYGKLCVNLTDGGDGLPSETAKRILNIPSVKARKEAAAKAGYARPEMRVKLSMRSKIIGARPEYKAKMSVSVRAAQARPEWKANHAAAMACPETKARWLAANKAAQNRPEVKARKSAITKALFARVETRLQHSTITKTAFANPEFRARHAASYERPEVKARMCAASKEIQSRPDVKARKAAALSTILAASAPYREEWVNKLRPALISVGAALPKVPNPAAKAETWSAFVDQHREVALAASMAPKQYKSRRAQILTEAFALPENKARHLAGCKARTAASAPHRDEWVNVIKPALIALGETYPNPPGAAARAETWATFVEHARALLTSKKDTQHD